jgi:hypothetical protein
MLSVHAKHPPQLNQKRAGFLLASAMQEQALSASAQLVDHVLQ